MKLKNILALAVGCSTALMMTVFTYAATEVKVENAYVEDGVGATLPVVLNTTETEITGKVATYELSVIYDSNLWTYDGYNDPNTYGSGRNEKPMGTVTTNPAINNDGSVELVFTCSGANGYPTITDGKLTLVEVYLAPKDSNNMPAITDNDFSVKVKYVDDENTKDGNAFDGSVMKSFFTFDVTGNLGGNEIVALGASTDGGVTIQPLEYYVSTDWTEGMAYADATTKFLVAVNNTKGTTDVADVTIYGELADGSYIPLASCNKNDFLVQSIYRG